MKFKQFICFAEYPVRPDMVLGESLAGYIYRYLAANGYTISIEIYLELRGLFNKKAERVARSQIILQRMVGTKLAVGRAEWHSHHLIFKKSFHAGGDYMHTIRFCPACLTEMQIHFSYWSYPLVEACPEHGCVLLTQCDQCGKSFSWYKLLPDWYCQCGASLLTQQSDLAHPRLVTLARLVVSATDVILPEDLKVRWAGITLVNRYNLEKLFPLLEGPYRYLLDEMPKLIPEKTLNVFAPH